jgi:hypothetical protein
MTELETTSNTLNLNDIYNNFKHLANIPVYSIRVLPRTVHDANIMASLATAYSTRLVSHSVIVVCSHEQNTIQDITVIISVDNINRPRSKVQVGSGSRKIIIETDLLVCVQMVPLLLQNYTLNLFT